MIVKKVLVLSCVRGNKAGFMDVPVLLTSDTEFSVFLPMSVRTPGLAVAK